MNRKCVAVAALAVLAACSGGHSEFQGVWANAGNPKNTLDVEPGGGGVTVHESAISVITGQREERDIPATVTDGALRLTLPTGTMGFTVDAKTGHLVGGGMEYVRTK